MATPLAVALGVAAFAAAWRRYGVFDFADEGVLLSQAWRAAHGQVPHVDFETGYGPLYFALQGAVLRAGGLVGIRLVLAAVHGAAAGLCFALARRLAGPTAAWLAVALQVALFLPVSPRLGTPINIPYPAWYGGVSGVAIAWLVTAPTARRLAVAGVIAGVVAAIKPNSGVLLVVGAALAAVAGDGRRGVLGVVVPLLAALTAVVLVAPSGVSTTAISLVPPVVGAATFAALRAGDDRTVLPRLLALGIGFALVVVPAYAPSFVALGPAGFARDVLLIGAGVAGVYELPYPAGAFIAQLWALVTFLPASPRPGWRRMLVTLWSAVVLFYGARMVMGPMDAGATAEWLRRGVETALLVAAPVVVIWGVEAGAMERTDLLPPVAVAAPALLQLYPRPDFAHLLPLGPLLLPLLVALPRGPRVRRWGFGIGAGLATVRFAPTALALAALLLGRTETVTVGREPLTIAPAGAPRLHALADAVRGLVARTSPEASVLAFPACTAVTFFADRRQAGPYEYFFPGRPDTTQVGALLSSTLAPAPPPVAVTCTAEGTGLARAWDYYPDMVAFLDGRYRVVASTPPFVVREALP